MNAEQEQAAWDRASAGASKGFRRFCADYALFEALSAACDKAAVQAIKVLAEEGEPRQFVPADPATWDRRLHFLVSRALSYVISQETGHGIMVAKMPVGED